MMKENDIIKNKIIGILKKHPQGMLIKNLATELKYSRQTISKYILGLKGEKKIIIRPIGLGKMIYLKGEKK